MQRQLVFIPIATDELAAISGQVKLTERDAHTVTPELLEALGYGPSESEDAEFAAMTLASVAALAAHGRRLVLVADVMPNSVRPGADAENGECVLTEVERSEITCWFSEAPGVDFADAAAAARGLGIDLAWDFPQVQELLTHDLLWNDVVEYRPE